MPPPLEAFAADLLALLEAPAPCAARDREPGTAGPRVVPAAVPAGPAEISSNNNGLQKSGPLGPLGPQKTDVAGFADSAAPPATPPAAAVDNRPAVDNFGAVDNSAPTGHCPVCGSPSFWRSPSSPGWRCAWCAPRDRSRAEAVESVTVAGGQWAPGCAPPADPDAGEDATGNQAQDRAPLRPADGRVQNLFGAWRLPTEHERIEAYDRHHWLCTACQRAGRGYGDRCPEGERLHAWASRNRHGLIAALSRASSAGAAS